MIPIIVILHLFKIVATGTVGFVTILHPSGKNPAKTMTFSYRNPGLKPRAIDIKLFQSFFNHYPPNPQCFGGGGGKNPAKTKIITYPNPQSFGGCGWRALHHSLRKRNLFM